MELIERLKNETLRQLLKKVGQLDDKAFEDSNLAKTKTRLFDELKIQTPEFLTNETTVKIGTEKAVRYDVPKGTSPGQDIYFAFYTVPVKSRHELFLRILGRHFWSDNFYCADEKVFFKKKSTSKIVGNGYLIEKIKKEAESRFDEITQTLNNFHLLAEEFNAAELQSKIDTTVEAEKVNRNNQKFVEIALNPYLL
ncbi:MAG: hypothetical protein KF734_03190 [Saprospiraceae bacterium]|nr:hypothetical protein [Saprospiraceae bacterium]